MAGEPAASRRNTTAPAQAEQIAKACLLAPDSGVDAASIAAFLATAQAHSTKHWLQLVNALAEYRLGHWNTVANWPTGTETNCDAWLVTDLLAKEAEALINKTAATAKP